VVHSVAIYEAGQLGVRFDGFQIRLGASSFDTVAGCNEAESAEYQKQNPLDLRVQLGINSWFPSRASVRALP